jgi:hypothetical protein
MFASRRTSSSLVFATRWLPAVRRRQALTRSRRTSIKKLEPIAGQCREARSVCGENQGSNEREHGCC